MIKQPDYTIAIGGLPSQNSLMTGRAIFTTAYAFIPRGVMRDIVTSYLPFWRNTRLWLLARPLSGFAETFSHYLMEIAPQGGSERPEADSQAEAVLFITNGALEFTLDGQPHKLTSGSYVYLAPGTNWQLHNKAAEPARFHWLRKAYDKVEGLEAPKSFVTHESQHPPVAMPDTNQRWSTTRFVDPADVRYDMHVNIVNFQPGGVIPFEETHVMEHGLYVLQGKAVYKLNQDWIEVEAGDYIWLRAFCPQACYAAGNEPFRYLLYKDVNRHAKLRIGGGADMIGQTPM